MTGRSLVVKLINRLKNTFRKATFSRKEAKIKYLMNEVSDLRSLVRYLLSDSQSYQRFINETYSSFEYQWDNLNFGEHLLVDSDFKRDGISYLEQYTGLPKSWFKDKKVLDAGCGNGRWSWVLCQCGAQVTAIDQSASGVSTARESCQEFSSFNAFEHHILQDLDMHQSFDLVWSYGVVHHTGNTWKAIQNLAVSVKPGGALFLMIYGEPRWEEKYDYNDVNTYTDLRRKFASMSFEERVDYLKKEKDHKNIHGWFDAVSPKINDLHRFDEIAEWLHLLGFEDIRITYPSRNLHIMAKKSISKDES